MAIDKNNPVDRKEFAETATAVGIPANQAATQAASTASDVSGLKTDFNALLTKLKAAGLMKS